MGNTGQGSSNGGGGSGASLTKRIDHPTVSKHFGEHFSPTEGRVWIQEHSSLGEQEARAAYKAIHWFTGSGFGSMHDAKTKEAKALVKQADKALTDPKMPVWKGELFRGVRLYDDHDTGLTAKQQMEAILKKGVWKEPGMTSFSSRKQVAEEFAHGGQVRLIVHITNNKSGVPIKHISKFSHEAEVLMNSKTAKKGWNIQSHTWNGNRVDIYVTEP